MFRFGAHWATARARWALNNRAGVGAPVRTILPIGETAVAVVETVAAVETAEAEETVVECAF